MKSVDSMNSLVISMTWVCLTMAYLFTIEANFWWSLWSLSIFIQDGAPSDVNVGLVSPHEYSSYKMFEVIVLVKLELRNVTWPPFFTNS